jgi:flagellin-like hook-associated protein FlgL
VASVSGSASSNVTSAAAKTALVARLSQAWTALNLNSLSALTISAGVTTGYSITSSTIMANASGVINGTGMTATILNGETLNINTGVYADSNGNWTDNKYVASALGLQEVVFHIANSEQMTYTTTMSNFASNTYLVSGTNVTVDINNKNEMTAAGLDIQTLLNMTNASLSGTYTGTGSTAAAASADLFAKVDAAWKAKYSAVTHRLDFQASDNGTAVDLAVGDFESRILAAAGSLNPSSDFSTSTDSVSFYVDVWVDNNTGNYTTDPDVAVLFPTGTFTQLQYTITGTGGSGTPPNSYVVTTNLSNGPTFSPITGTNITGLDSYLQANANIQHVITGVQGSVASTGTNEGRLSFNPTGSTSLPLDHVEFDAQKLPPSSSGTPTNLTVTVDMAGTTSALTTGSLSGLPRSSTTLATLVTQTAAALSEVLLSAQSKAAFTGMGRINTSQATAPSAPRIPADLTNPPTIDVSFVSGTLDRSVATGSFDDSGYVFSSSKGYGLTSAQLAILKQANVDLSNLLLASAIVSTSASSTVSSASARALLLEKLDTMWTALGLGSLSAIVSESGATTGFDPITATTMGYAGNATVPQGQTITVHTGVYADANGNWTTDVRLANDLKLDEIVYTITNNDYTSYRYDATFTSPDYQVYSAYAISSTEISDLNAAGIVSLPPSFSWANATASGSAASLAAASAALYYNIYTEWTTKYAGKLSAIALDVGATLTGLNDLTPAQIAMSAALPSGGTPGQVTGNGPNDELVADQGTFTVHTGIYADANGNWTDDSALATLFSFDELTYQLSRNSGPPDEITVERFRGSTSEGINNIAGNTNLQALGGLLINDTTYGLEAWVNAGLSPLEGKLTLKGSADVTMPTMAQVDAARTGPTSNTVNNGPAGIKGQLDATVTIAGTTEPAFGGTLPPPQAVTQDMDALASAINTSISELLKLTRMATEASTLYTHIGRLSRTAPTPPEGPKAETDIDDLNTVDIYKSASPAQTVTSQGIIDSTKHVTVVATEDTPYFNSAGISNFGAWALASAINHNADSQFWAMIQSHDSSGNKADMVYIFSKYGGDNNHLLACDVADGDIASQEALKAIEFENTESSKINQDGTSFTLGGQEWGKLKPIQTKAGMGKEVWNLTINGRDVGKERDLWIAAVSDGENEIKTPGLDAGIINGLDRYSFVEIQNAANGEWAGAEVRTQSSAQEALEALNTAMERKDKVRADIGALQNRLENTMTNLEIQIESLQASESRISDVDVATEMTEFVRNQVLAQAAVSMLSQANSLPQMALSLLNG